MLDLVAEILQERSVSIDRVEELAAFQQTTDVGQGDNLTLLFFSVLINDLPKKMSSENELVYMLC